MARKPSPDDVLVASESFSGALADGTSFSAQRDNTRIRASHPAAKRWPDYFKPIDVHYDVEQATASPGEKRGETRTEPAPVEQATAAPGEKRQGLTTDSLKGK